MSFQCPKKGLLSREKQSKEEVNMKNTKGKCFSIGEAAKMCGCSVKQIRHWEERKYIPEAERVVCGERSYRKYGEDDLEFIKRIARYLDIGYTLAMAAKKAEEDTEENGGK